MPLFADTTVTRTILVEEAFATREYLDGPVKNPATAQVRDELVDIGAGRLAAMDEAGVDMHVLSLTSPGVEQVEDGAQALAMAKQVNDRLAEACRAHPKRFVGFATVPTGAPELASRELERCIEQLGMKGVLINGHARGRYLDDEAFRPLLARIESLGVPLYIHPTMPPPAVMKASYGGLSDNLTTKLAGAAWGWHFETGLHVLRMIMTGVFDRFPRLQVMIGHMGEGLPYMLPRIEHVFATDRPCKRPLRAYLNENLTFTFSGCNFSSMFHVLRNSVGTDRIVFSADWPYGSMNDAMAFLLTLDVSQDEREAIAHGNVEKLLRL